MPWSYANIDWDGTGAMVQAVGSVAAIVAAIWIDQGAARRSRSERDQDRRDYLALILGLAREAACDIAGASEALRDKAYGDVIRGGTGPDVPSTTENVMSIRELDLNRMPTAEVALAMIKLRRLSGWRDRYTSMVSSDWSNGPGIQFETDEALAWWASEAQQALAVVEAAAARNGIVVTAVR